jgi:hypothetical protein
MALRSRTIPTRTPFASVLADRFRASGGRVGSAGGSGDPSSDVLCDVGTGALGD